MSLFGTLRFRRRRHRDPNLLDPLGQGVAFVLYGHFQLADLDLDFLFGRFDQRRHPLCHLRGACGEPRVDVLLRRCDLRLDLGLLFLDQQPSLLRYLLIHILPGFLDHVVRLLLNAVAYGRPQLAVNIVQTSLIELGDGDQPQST